MDDKELNMHLGRQLQKYRNQRLLSLEDVAGKVSMNDKHLGRIERGEKDTIIAMLFKLTQVLKHAI